MAEGKVRGEGPDFLTAGESVSVLGRGAVKQLTGRREECVERVRDGR